MLIEDDLQLLGLLSDYLTRFGFEVTTVSEFGDIEEQFETVNPHLVLLDINLPYYDGFYLCKSFRRKSNIPIFLLSARDGRMDQVLGMETGADDYIIKPVDPVILLSKIKAAFRRAYGEYANLEPLSSLYGLIIHENSFRLEYKGKTQELSKNEFRLFHELYKSKGNIVSRDALLNALWDDSAFVDDNTLTVNVARIKAKCQELDLPELIKTKRGVGYYLDVEYLKEGASGV